MKKNINISDERAYDVIVSPRITEKSTILGEYNQYVFDVSIDAQKPEIKQAVERIFKGVNVLSVNTIRQKGKSKMWQGRKGRRKDTKKAIVRLKEGQTIDVAGQIS